MNLAVKVIPARLTHVGPIASRMRAIDVLECHCMGDTPKQALRRGLGGSDMVWTALVDDRPEAMFGYSTVSAVEGLAAPWFLGTDEVMRHGRELLGMATPFLKVMRDSTLRLENLVSARNHRAIRLLKRWGFEIGDETLVLRGEPFYKFGSN